MNILRGKWRWALMCSIVLGCVVWLGQSAPASASPYLPDAANFNPAGAGGDPWLEVSAADGVNVQLQAPVLWLKIYSPTPNITIDFDNLANCGPDYGAPVSTIATIFRSTARENLENPVVNMASVDTGGAVNCGNYTLAANGLVRSTVPGHTNFYVGLIQVFYNGPPGSINRFKVWGGGQEIGYWDQGGVEDIFTGVVTPVNDAYAPTNPNFNPLVFYGVGSAFALQSPSTQPMDMTLEFAPSCDVTTNRIAYLKWFDADRGLPNQRGDPWITLDEFDENGVFVGTQINTNDVGGGDEFRALAFTAVPNHRYRWTWHNVDQNNGIQFWLPYDSQNYYLVCDVPPVGLFNNFETTCDTLGGWAVDVDSPATAVTVKVYRDGLPAFGGTLVATVLANEVGPAGEDPYPGGYVGGRHGFSVNISPYKDYSSHRYFAYVVNINRAGAPVGDEPLLPTNNPQQIGPCMPPPTCSSLQVVAADGTDKPEPDDPFQVRIGMEFPPAAIPSFTFGYTIMNINFPGTTGLPPSANGIYPAFSNIYTFSNVRQSGYGSHPGSWTVRINGSNPLIQFNCSGTYIVANKPYFKAYGNDVQAGGNYATSSARTCVGPADPAARIIGYSNGVGVNYKGATSQYAAFALGTIDGFSSAGTRGTAPAPPKDLTFANSAANVYGGGSSITHCVPNYMTEFLATGPAAGPANVNSIPAGNSKQYVAGNGTLTSPGGPGATLTVPAGSHATIYVDGNLVINTNIVFAGADAGGWTSRAQIPSLTVIVRGNIFINKLVTRLDGVFIAQPGIAGPGTINTCVAVAGNSGNATPVSAVSVFDNCNSKLTVNGSFIAQRVKLLRVNGSYSKSVVGEARGGIYSAEEFNSSPETYLALPDCTIPQNCGSSAKADAITSLPPIL